MTSILRLRMYALEMRALRANKRSNIVKVKGDVNQPHIPLHMRKDRILARTYIVITHNLIANSKAIIFLSEDLSDNHTVCGAFHQLRIAKAFKQLVNS